MARPSTLRGWCRPLAVDLDARIRENLYLVTGKSDEYEVLWHCSSLASSEHASLVEMESGCRLRGLALLPLGGEPCHIDYDVLCDRGWMPRSCSVSVALPKQVRKIELRRADLGRWEYNGTAAAHLMGCSDIDLGWTPATNTIPIRRLDLEVGDTASILAAWVRFPELDVVTNQQHYTRMASNRWRYRSDEYDFELVTDASSGLVLEYGLDLWRAVGQS